MLRLSALSTIVGFARTTWLIFPSSNVSRSWRGRDCFSSVFLFICLVCFFISNIWIYYHCNNLLNTEIYFFNLTLYCNMKLPLLGCLFVFLTFKMANSGNSLVVQWLGLGALTARGPGSIPSWGVKILQAVRLGQKKLELKLKVFKNGKFS